MRMNYLHVLGKLGFAYLICVHIPDDTIDNVLTGGSLQFISQCIFELFNFYIPTLIPVEVCEGFLNVFIVANFPHMDRNSNEFCVVQGPIFINISLQNIENNIKKFVQDIFELG